MQTIAKAAQGDFLVLPNDSLGKSLLEQKEFEPHFYNLVKNIIKPGDVCIDAGANLGYHTVTMGKLVGNVGKIIAFEPQRIIYQQLNGNVFLNNLRNVICIHSAIGNKCGTVKMDHVDYDATGVNIGCTKIGYGGEDVNLVRLDDIITEGVSFMKIDIQGSEVMLLEGAQELISHSRPIMFIEVENEWLRCFGASSEILLNKLLELNYILVRINTDYACDHLAVPRERSSEIPDIIKDVKYTVDIIDGKKVKITFDRTSYTNMIYGSFEIFN